MSVPLPVGEGPRRFFVITVCFFMKPCYHRSEWGGSANFGLGSNPNHEVWTMARADSFETMNLSELARQHVGCNSTRHLRGARIPQK